MIQMQLTDAGLAAITRNENIVFTKFVTGSGTEGTDYIVVARQDVPISYSQTYIKGQSYLINGVQTTVNYNAVELIGTLSSSQASESYTWTELALMAREGAGQEYTFAYGISVNNAYRVNPAEPVTFVIPFSVIFASTPNVTVTTTDTGVSWAAFMEHANLNVITGAHGLEVKNGRIFVNNVELDIATQTALTTDVNTVRAEMQLADGDLSDSIDGVESSLTASIQSVNTNLTTSINSLNTDLSQSIQDVQDNLDTEVSSLETSIDETSTALDTRITNVNSALTTSINDLNTSLSGDISDLDTNLTSSISSVESSLTESIGTVNTNLTNSINTKTAALLLDLNNRTKNILGVDIIVDTLPLTPIDYLGQVALLTTDDKWYRSEYRDIIEPGDWIKAVDGVWLKVSPDTEDAMLVVADDAELGNLEIHVSDAQAYFTIWSPLRDVNVRLEDLESTTTNYLTYRPLDDAEYNDETIVRMTGSGTAADPYLIYTPMDFEQIRVGGANTYKYYKLANNLDFSKAIGIKVNKINGEINYEVVDDTAPLYNSGKGFVPFPTKQSYFNLDGGNHTIRNIIIADTENYDGCGIFRYIEYSTISNLIIKDTYINYTRGKNVKVGTLVGQSSNQCQISNIISHANITTNTMDYEANVGGIIGCVNYRNRITSCAFHGTIKNINRDGYSYFGGIVGYDSSDDSSNDKSTFTSCYNTSSFIGWNVAGLCRRGTIFYNCYNSGTIESINGTSSSFSFTTLTGDVIIDNCYALEGCAGTMQGTVLTDSQLRSPSAVDYLNTGLPDPVWVSSEGGYPMLDFEMLNEASLSPSIPIAAVDPVSKLVIDSGYTLGRLLHVPSNATIVDIRREIAEKSNVSKLSITLASDSWSNNKQTITNLSTVTANSVLVLIPKSADCFDAGIYIESQADGSITFGYTAAPSDSINVDVLVIN